MEQELEEKEIQPAKAKSSKKADHVPWTKVEFGKVDPKKFEEAMLQAGIKSYDDARANPMTVQGIIMSFVRTDFASVIQFARDYEKEK